MSGIAAKPLFEPRWQGELTDYVTAIAWSPTSPVLASSSAAGEVVLHFVTLGARQDLQAATGASIDALAFSHDGQFLAAGGQNGQVTVWQLQGERAVRVAALDIAPAWVDQMAWSPTRCQLAFSLGKYVQVWDAAAVAIVATLNFDSSSVLDITWHPDGNRLTVSGYQGVKIWTAADWDDDPYLLTIPSASVAIAWSSDGKYIASGNLDRTITVLEWDNPHPWVMRGFPGKIRQLTWSELPRDRKSSQKSPLLATASAESLVTWEKHPDEAIGWEGQVLGNHAAPVNALRFQPGSTLLASGSEDGWLMLWQNAKQLVQRLNGTSNGFSSLAWHPQGRWLAAGGCAGEVLIWSQVQRGTGFKRNA
jgi:WD40 repeat protein